ncbi:selenium metabolism membrane protein YedE/FdhT [Eoetvoesia caeni]|nr:selenium metabolism membrane protein YedE/FdhT [Eoetvoesiella caeni]
MHTQASQASQMPTHSLRFFFNHYWRPFPVLVAAGALSAIYFGLTGTVWAVTGEFTRLGGQMLHLAGVDTSDWAYFKLVKIQGGTLSRTDGWIVWGMFIGALITVLLSNSFKIRIPQQRRRWVQALAGGIVAGFGARLAMGCNLAAFFTGVPQFSFHAWIFIVATGLGTLLGTRLIKNRWWKGRPTLTKGKAAATPPGSLRIQPVVGGLLALGYACLIVYFFVSGLRPLGIAALFGAMFGILIERGQICFTSAFRDLWIMGRAVMSKAIIAGMALSAVMTIIVISVYGLSPITQIAAPSTFVGGLLFGLGIVMATSCETGMMYRLMEGQVLYLVVFIGNIAGATLLAYAWDHLGIYNLLVAPGEKINLVSSIGPTAAIVITLAMLGLLYAYTLFHEKRHLSASLMAARA